MLIAGIKELYNYRELLYRLAVKEIQVKYKNTALGFLWTILNPLLLMIVFSFIFTVVFRGRQIENYPLFFLCGILPWNFFTGSLNRAVTSIIANENLIKKVYFPREIIPISILLASLVDLVISFCVLFLALFIFGYTFYFYLPLLILAIFLLFVLSAGFSLALACANVYFRDIQHLLNIILIIWFYGTPIMYDLSMVPERFHLLIKFVNPMTSIILLFREALYWNKWPSESLLLYAVVISLVVFALGYRLFGKYSPVFAKEI